MQDRSRRRYEMFIRVNKFGIDNAADFAGIALAVTLLTQIGVIVDDFESRSAAQESGFSESAQQFEIKDTAREDVRDKMSVISRTSKSMEYAIDGISDKFRFKRNLSDAALLARGRAFVIELAPYETEFRNYGMPSHFLSDLTTALDAFEASFSSTASATSEHVEATAAQGATVRDGMVAVRTLDGIAENIYAHKPGKLAAWRSASHVEKDPDTKKKDPAPPTP